MATPNMPSSAQDIINNFLSGGYASEAQANPYRVDVDPFRPPKSDDSEDNKPDNDPCPEGYVYDPVVQSCVPIVEERDPQEGDGDTLGEDPTTRMLRDMRNDPTTGYGASNILDDYITEGLGQGTFLKFDPNIGRLGAGSISPFMNFGGGLLDAMFMQPQRRENKYNDAIKFMQDNAYGQSVGNDLFNVFTPQQYYRNVSGNALSPKVPITPQGQNLTVGQAVEAVVNQERGDQVYDPLTGTMRSSNANRNVGSPISEDLSGGLLYTSPLTSVDSSGNRSRNNDAYKSAIARNIERNKKNTGTSGFSMNVGGTGKAGFYRGR